MGEAPLEAGQLPGTHAAGKHLGLKPGQTPGGASPVGPAPGGRDPSSRGPGPGGPRLPPTRPRKSTARLLWALFALFVVYGTTFPFRFGVGGWDGFLREAARINWRPLGGTAENLLVSDIVQNILLFMPFGFLGYFSLVYKSSWSRKAAVVALGASLSAGVEFLQIFSPVRFPALSDVIFNTLGTACGLLVAMAFKRSVLGFKNQPQTRRFLDAPSAFPAFVFAMLVAAGCWEPFDFSLDIGMVIEHVKPLVRHPFALGKPDDDLMSFIRFLLASLFACRLFAEAGLRLPALRGAALLGALGTGLELSQVFIQSRGPEWQDAAVAALGAAAGGIAWFFPGFHLRPRVWTLAGGAMIFLSAAARAWYPYDFSSSWSGFNWVPFRPYYEHTSFRALGDFIESAMLFFPFGFLLAYFHPRARMIAAGSLCSGALAVLVEIAQGFVRGRFADITDVLGAALGGFAGALALARGWPAFREYMARDDDSQV
jgi:glycopeptide antibiotics resistance protein